MSEKVLIKVDLEGSLASDFKLVKKYLGIKNSTDVIRMLVRDKANKIRSQDKELVDI